MSAYIQPELFAFFRDLSENNEREWFQDNKDRFESDVREPLLRFISDFEPRLKAISPHYDAIAKKSGGSLFRIYRDVRFSKDKRPYKTQAGVHFRHTQAESAYAPGYYLHLEPGSIFMGAGVWHPPSDALKAIREAIDGDPETWVALTRDKAILKDYHLSGEDHLKRPPKGFAKDHPLIEDLKRKSFIFVRDLTPAQVQSEDFLTFFEGECRRLAPFMAFLTRGVGLPF